MKITRRKSGVWVTYPKAKEVQLKIRPVYFSQSLDLLEEVKEKRVVEGMPIDPKDLSKRGSQVVDDYKGGDFSWKMFDLALEDWKGIDVETEEGDAPLGPVEVKRVLFDNDPLREFVFEQARKFAEMEFIVKEQEEKN